MNDSDGRGRRKRRRRSRVHARRRALWTVRSSGRRRRDVWVQPVVAELDSPEPGTVLATAGRVQRPRRWGESVLGTLRLPPHTARITAFGIDALLVSCVFGAPVLAALLARAVSGSEVVNVWSLLVGLCLCLACVMGLPVWLTGGRSVGKAACGLMVVGRDHTAVGRSLGALGWALGRHGLGYLVVDAFGIFGLAAFERLDRCGWHDSAFGGRVVQVEDSPALSPAERLRARALAFDYDLRMGVVAGRQNYRWLAWAWALPAWFLAVLARCTFAAAGHRPHLVAPAPALTPVAVALPASSQPWDDTWKMVFVLWMFVFGPVVLGLIELQEALG